MPPATSVAEHGVHEREPRSRQAGEQRRRPRSRTPRAWPGRSACSGRRRRARRDDDDDARRARSGRRGSRRPPPRRSRAAAPTARGFGAGAVDQRRRRLQREQDAERGRRASPAARRCAAAGTPAARSPMPSARVKASVPTSAERRLRRAESRPSAARRSVARRHRLAPVARLMTPGAAVGEHDPETDAGDQRAGPEAEQCEEDDLVHVCLRSWRERRRGCAALLPVNPYGGRCNRRRRLELALAVVREELRLVVAHTAGASGYLPHSIVGAPEACGPLNALACSAIVSSRDVVRPDLRSCT